MIINSKLSFCFLSIFLLLASLSLALDPESLYQQCQQQCRRQQPGRHQEQCMQQCEEYRQCQQQCPQRGQESQQCQQRCEEQYGQQDGGGLSLNIQQEQDPQKEYQQCQQVCRQKSGQQQQQCQEFCDEYRCQQECSRQPGQAQQQCQLQCAERYGREQQDGFVRLNIEQGQDPERVYQICQQVCRQKPGEQQQECQEFCDEFRQCQQECSQQPSQAQPHCQLQCVERYGREQQDGVIRLITEKGQDPQREYQQCQQDCRKKPGQQQQQCREFCEEYQQCQQECRQKPGQAQQQCLLQCVERYSTEQQDDGHLDKKGKDLEKKYQKCQKKCGKKQGQEQQQCKQRCEEKYRREQEAGGGSAGGEQQAGGGRSEGQQGGGSGEGQQTEGGSDMLNTSETQDPQMELQQCQQECRQQQQGQEQQQRCMEQCKKELEKQQKEQGSGEGKKGYEGEAGQQGGEEADNPYLFRQERFSSHVKSQEGNVRVLERFNMRSNLLNGIENYRVAILETNPNTVELPNHWDADTVCFVIRGRGAITLIQEENNKATHNLERGDIIRVRAGTVVSMVNRDSNEKLYVVTLIQPVSTPGQFEAFYGPGSRDQESIYNAFSKEILEAAFNTPSDQLRRLFEGQRNQGGFVKASREQIQALSGRSSKQGPWPFRRGGESQSNRPYNLLNQSPLQSNQYGQLYKANPDDYEELQELDVAVSLANITEGAIFGPYYNSRSTKIVMVVDGNGCFEMACPHLSRQQGQQGNKQSGSTYQRVRACVSSGDVFVVPAGHPIAIVASTDQNLEVACFEIKAENNQMYALAGKNNILKQLQRESKELSFNVPAKQVEQILNKQQESWFYPGPEQRQQHDGHPSA